MDTLLDLVETAFRCWDDGAVLARVGTELQDRSRLDLAERTLERAVELAPHDVHAWENLAYARLRALKTEEGRQAFREGIAATRSDLLKALLIGFTEGEEAERLRRETAATTDLAARANLASQRLGRGEVEAGLAEVRDLAHRHPDDEDVRSVWLWSLLGARNRGLPGVDLRAEGIPLADRALRERPDAVGRWFLKILMLQAEKDWDGVLAATEAALERFPDEETMMQHRARAFREKGDEERAIQWLLRAVGAKPSFVGARVDLGKLYEKRERPDLAEEVFREIPRANPGYPLGPVSLALFLARRGRHEEAELTFLETWPRIPEPWRQGIRANPAAQELLARDAVRLVVG